ncbi:uncharacterized protein LOC144178815 [Haemaphysalis longicornis]
MAEAEKPFACDVSGCGIKFVCEDKLTSHKRRHKMMLSLNFANSGAGPRNCIEQTPTPTRFMDMFEEAGLFQELQPEFTTPEVTPHVNPFEADFRRASNGEIATKELGHAPGTSEPLNTPCIPPVTADPIALRASFTPGSAVVPNFERATVACPKAEPPSDSSVSSTPVEEQSAQASTPEERESVPLEPANVVTIIAEGTEEALLSPLVDDKAAVLQAAPCADLKSPMTGAIPAASIRTVAAPVTQVIEGPKIEPTPIVAQAIGTLPGAKATIITSSNVIQLSDNVQLVIVTNPTPVGTRSAQSLAAPVVPLVQQTTRAKLKDALPVKIPAGGSEKQVPECTLPMPPIQRPPSVTPLVTGPPIVRTPVTMPSVPGPPIAPLDKSLSYGVRSRHSETTDEERKKKNREINRYAAQRSRAKKKRLNEALWKELDNYKKLCSELTTRNQELMSQRAAFREKELQYKDDIFKLKKQLAQHSNCSVTLEQQKKEKDSPRSQEPRTETATQPPGGVPFISTLTVRPQLSLLVARDSVAGSSKWKEETSASTFC